MSEVSQAVGCVVIPLIVIIVVVAAVALFYFHLPIVFVLVGILVFIRLFFKIVIGWRLVNIYVGKFLYPNLLLLIVASACHLLAYTVSEYVILGMLLPLNWFLVKFR